MIETRWYRVPILGSDTEGNRRPKCVCEDHARDEATGEACNSYVVADLNGLAFVVAYECRHDTFWTTMDSDPECLRIL